VDTEAIDVTDVGDADVIIAAIEMDDITLFDADAGNSNDTTTYHLYE
jgi:hypothetical protein